MNEQEQRYAVPHVGQFSDRAEELWKDMRDHVLRLAARYGEDAVNKAGPRWFAEVDVKNGKVSFQGTTDDIAQAVDEITEKLEG